MVQQVPGHPSTTGQVSTGAACMFNSSQYSRQAGRLVVLTDICL
jgi:hypothetical protein